MEFGKVTDISKIDLSLPADHADTINVLSKSKVVKDPMVFAGCAKWGRKEWVNKLYPPKTKATDFLTQYSKQVNGVELNATYHRIPNKEMIKGWADKSDDDFLFCTKFPRIITHDKRLKNTETETKIFYENTSLFGKKLGPYFLMLHPSFSPKHSQTLIDFLKVLPSKHPLFIEFRHDDWFKPSTEAEETFEFLKKAKIGVIITDTPGERNLIHQRLTIPSAFIRFTGHNLHPSDYSRIDEWIIKVKEWFDHGLESLYFFVHQDMDDHEVNSPELAEYFISRLNKKMKLGIKQPVLYPDTPDSSQTPPQGLF